MKEGCERNMIHLIFLFGLRSALFTMIVLHLGDPLLIWCIVILCYHIVLREVFPHSHITCLEPEQRTNRKKNVSNKTSPVLQIYVHPSEKNRCFAF